MGVPRSLRGLPGERGDAEKPLCMGCVKLQLERPSLSLPFKPPPKLKKDS